MYGEVEYLICTASVCRYTEAGMESVVWLTMRRNEKPDELEKEENVLPGLKHIREA